MYNQYNQPNNVNYQIKSSQFNIMWHQLLQGPLKEHQKRNYQELGQDRRWLRHQCYLYKIVSTKTPPYLYEVLPPPKRSQRNPSCFKPLRCRTENSLKILSYHLLLVNETNWILTLEMLTLICYSARTFYLFIEHIIYSIYDPLNIKLHHRL